MAIQSINPATGEVLKTFEEMSDAEVDRALAQAQAAYERWRETSFSERAAKLRNVASYLRAHRDENAERIRADEHIQTNAADSYVAYTPLGVILAIMPWNFPFWQVFRPIAPAVMAGNALVLKHSS